MVPSARELRSARSQRRAPSRRCRSLFAAAPGGSDAPEAYTTTYRLTAA
jgi:hypothetical protein